LKLSAEIPKSYGFAWAPKTLGEHLRKKRIDQGMIQKDVAKLLCAGVWNVRNWEVGHSTPAIRFLPAIIRFLGYDPRPIPETFAAKLTHLREGMGLSQEALGRLIGADESAVNDWEAGLHEPTKKSLAKVRRMFPELAALVQ
jgi:DNA-binding transcriptional regulator YiaG